jgi:hypothetical protein
MTELTAVDRVRLRAAECGVVRPGATADELARFDEAYPAPPEGLRDLLAAFDGEWFPSELVPHCRLVGVAEILTDLDSIEEMVVGDTALPECFEHFVPFLRTDAKSDVGAFTADSPILANVVVEVHYQSHGAVVWSESVDAFFARLLAADAPDDPIRALGSAFPIEGTAVLDIETHFG